MQGGYHIHIKDNTGTGFSLVIGPSQPAFPGHQPVLDTEGLKRYCNTYLTTSEEAYQYHKQKNANSETPNKPTDK